MKIIKQEDMNTSQWSGGTTTQIMLYPENGDYGKRDFLWRLSSARVELEKSDFTSLPGVERILMVLEGTLKIIHQGHHSKVLAPYETDVFRGDWTTTSEGRVTDFNLMTKGNVSGHLDKIIVPAGGKYGIELPMEDEVPEKIWVFFYCPEADIDFAVRSEKLNVGRGELLLLTETEDAAGLVLENNNHQTATVVFGKITQGRGGQSCFK